MDPAVSRERVRGRGLDGAAACAGRHQLVPVGRGAGLGPALAGGGDLAAAPRQLAGRVQTPKEKPVEHHRRTGRIPDSPRIRTALPGPRACEVLARDNAVISPSLPRGPIPSSRSAATGAMSRTSTATFFSTS